MDESIDFSAALEKVQQMLSDENGQSQLQNIIGALTGNQSADASADDCGNEHFPVELLSQGKSSDSFDMDMFLKLQKLMSLMKSNKNNPHTDFLQTLRPFLKSSRQKSLDQAVKLINAVQAIKLFRSINEGSD